MAAVFGVLVLYHIPGWIEAPIGVLQFIALLAAGLILDAVLNIVRYKRPVCAVSAAVTAAMISVLTFEAPFWGRLLGVTAALVLGKHMWGGTGRNILNPAMIGLMAVILIFDVSYPFFAPSWLLLPGLLLGLPFIRFRPFAAVGFMSGMASALFVGNSLTLDSLLTYGVFFWGSLVLTDPVTVTSHPAAGALIGLLGGFAALFFQPAPIAVVTSVLAVNLISFAVGLLTGKVPGRSKPSLRIGKVTPYPDDSRQMLDLTGRKESNGHEETDLSTEEILERIRKNEVFGFGGAGFSTYRKIMTVMEAKVGRKHLIINAVECDPGLIHDHWLLRRHADEIHKGLELLRRLIKPESATLAVKDDEGLSTPKSIELRKIRECFPAGAERILISEVLNRRMTQDMVPAACGILVLNVQTLYSIYNAVYTNEKADTRYLTVANLKEKRAKVVKVRLGMQIREVLDAVFPNAVYAFAGGGLMQSYLADEEAVVDKTVNYIATAEFPRYKESPLCSRCGLCKLNCPAGLDAGRIADLVDQGDRAAAKRYSPERCMSCGSCSYSCLAGRNLAARVKAAKEL